jgi:hypothetical protein
MKMTLKSTIKVEDRGRKGDHRPDQRVLPSSAIATTRRPATMWSKGLKASACTIREGWRAGVPGRRGESPNLSSRAAVTRYIEGQLAEAKTSSTG